MTNRLLKAASDQELLLRYSRVLEQQKGYEDLPGSRYLGDQGKMLLKYKIRIKDALYASFTAEKDAGEPLFKENTRIDFSSWQISYHGVGKVQQLVLGDYTLQFGQGLSLWSGFGYGKGADVTTLAKNDAGLKPYTSANELSFLRGLAIVLSPFKYITVTAFRSSLKQDASLRTQSDGSTAMITLSESGLHRTASELKNKDDVIQNIYGSVVQYRSSDLEMGFSGYRSAYTQPFITGNALYNQNNFVGSKLTNTSFSYNYTFKNLYLYGETAKSFPGGWSILNGLLGTLSKRISVGLMQRLYGKNHYTFLSRSLGEGSNSINEQGWYAGLNWQLNNHLLLSIASDKFKFLAPKYRIDDSSSGYEHLAQLNYNPAKTLKLLARVKLESKAQNGDSPGNLAEIQKWSIRLNINWQANAKLGMDGRIEKVHYRKAALNEDGLLIYHDINYKLLKSLKMTGRLAWFKTDSYNSRLYAYEDDVLYSSGFGLYQGHGFRTYLNLGYTPIRSNRNAARLSVYIRYSLSLYPGETTVGSGLDIITGNRKSELKLQARIQI
ncbi:MAG: helix-hairpin-helix domain-containing protein [Pedobacter sp.]|nr:MAG: helix-hairpin-helix domain-containing protein [Pedobacter sp.]